MQVKSRGTSFVPFIIELAGTGWEIRMLGRTENYITQCISRQQHVYVSIECFVSINLKYSLRTLTPT